MAASMQTLPLFSALGAGFSDIVEPAAFADARLRHFDARLARSLGLSGLDTPDRQLAHLAAFEPIDDRQPDCLAMRYHGHQFDVYNPQIGDGRGFLLYQGARPDGRPFDLGTKGSGQTPHSRSGDGRMTLQAGMREVLIADQLAARGVTTCRILSLVETGERLHRHDEPSPARGAVMVRAQATHIRIGTFQYHAYGQDKSAMIALIDHVIARHFPEADAFDVEKKARHLLAEAARLNLEMVAGWQVAGFVHGVMNSDNMTLMGVSFDYGPSRFLAAMAPDFTAAYFDQAGLYAFERQPHAAMTNLARLAQCLSLVAEMKPFFEILEHAAAHYLQQVEARLCQRLGVELTGERLSDKFHAFLLASQLLPEAVLFDWRGGEMAIEQAMAGPRARDYHRPEFLPFRAALASHEPLRDARHGDYFERRDPVHLRIDHLREIWAAIEDDGDWSGFHQARHLFAEQEAAYRAADKTTG